jgi:Fic family protein
MEPFNPEILPPKSIDLVALMPLAGKANRAIAKLEGLLHGIPNPDVLLSPMTTQEAILSSKIEGTQADLEDVLRFEAGESPAEASRREDIHEIQNYRTALRRSEQLLSERPFCLNSVLMLHEVLMNSVRGHNKSPGRFRTKQNWIGTPGTPIQEAAFIPPSPIHLQEHLRHWEIYWHSEGPDTLVQLALIHAQFEIIHPFDDGNGRLGRLFIPLFLYEKKILSRPCFYLSAFFETRRDEYVALLRALGQQDSWTRWCGFFLEGVASQAEASAKTALAIQALYERLKDQLLHLTHSQFAVPLLDYIFTRPIFRSSEVTLTPMPSPPMVANLLSKLRQSGILITVREGAGRRPHVLALGELINLCEGRRVF